MRKEQVIKNILIRKNKTLAVAESCTGGLLANKLTNISDSSQYFLLGVIAYSNKAKTKILKVPTSILQKHGAVSKQTAILMAQNIQKLAKADVGLAITGIAGPTGGSKNKPVGTVFIAVKHGKKEVCKRFNFKGTRLSIKRQAANTALECALSLL